MNVASFCVSPVYFVSIFSSFFTTSIPSGFHFLLCSYHQGKVPLNVWVDIVHSYFKMKHFLKSPLKSCVGWFLYSEGDLVVSLGSQLTVSIDLSLLEWSASLRKDSSSLKPGDDKPGQQCSPAKWQTRTRRPHHLIRRSPFKYSLLSWAGFLTSAPVQPL